MCLISIISIVCLISLMLSCIFVKGTFCFWSWIRWCVLSWRNTWKCQYGIPSVKRPLMNGSKLKSMCKCIFRWFSACLAVTLCSFDLRYSSKGSIVKKMPILNKNIVHLVDDMFWNMGFKTETHAEKVVSIIHIILYIWVCIRRPLFLIFFWNIKKTFIWCPLTAWNWLLYFLYVLL